MKVRVPRIPQRYCQQHGVDRRIPMASRRRLRRRAICSSALHAAASCMMTLSSGRFDDAIAVRGFRLVIHDAYPPADLGH